MAMDPEEGVAAPEKMDKKTVPVGKEILPAKKSLKDDLLVKLFVIPQSPESWIHPHVPSVCCGAIYFSY